MSAQGSWDRFCKLYVRAQSFVHDLDQLDQAACAYLGTFLNILERLPVMSKPNSYGLINSLPSYVTKVQGRQGEALEDVLNRLKGSISSAGDRIRDLEQLSVEASRVCQAELGGAGPDALRVRLGPRISIAECVEGLQDICRIYREEQALRSILVQRLHYSLSQEECGVIRAAFSGRPGVSGAVTGPKDILHRVLDASSA